MHAAAVVVAGFSVSVVIADAESVFKATIPRLPGLAGNDAGE